MRFRSILIVLVYCFVFAAVVRAEGVSLSFDSDSGKLVLTDSVDKQVLSFTPGKGYSGKMNKGTFNMTGPDKSEIVFSVVKNELVVSGSEDIDLQFDSELHADKASPCFALSDKADDNQVLVMRYGAAEIPSAKSLFDPERDIVLTANGKKVAWKLDKTWKLRVRGNVRIKVVPDYYRKELEVPFYKPFKKKSYWNTAPIVALTWYSLGIERGHTFEEIKPEVDWISENLLPYAGKLVFQLDDNYNYKDDAWARKVSDYIRSKGLIPGIWFTCFSVAPSSVIAEHPKWFLLREDGYPQQTFSGINWKWTTHWGKRRNKGTSGAIDVSNEDAVKAWFVPWWKKVSETWNYDYFKVDGMQPTLKCYRAVYGEEKGLKIFRKGLQIGRDAVDPNKFINACNQTPREAMGIFEGSRTGGDAQWKEVKTNPSGIIFNWNYLNNYTIWCDADAVIMQYARKVENVRYHSICRAMTGQQFITDDKWSKMPPENAFVWERCFPSLNIYPVNLYSDCCYDVLDLRIARPWGTYDIVALLNNNYRHPGVKTMKMSQLPLDGSKFHVYDFWDKKYLGVQGLDYEWSAEMAPHTCKMFTIVPVAGDGRPTLISTSRHFSQGALDIETLEYQQKGNGWEVEGKSSHLVKDDPYELVFATDNFVVTKAVAGDLKVTVKVDGKITTVSVVPKQSGSINWTVKFISKDAAKVTRFSDAAGNLQKK